MVLFAQETNVLLHPHFARQFLRWPAARPIPRHHQLRVYVLPYLGKRVDAIQHPFDWPEIRNVQNPFAALVPRFLIWPVQVAIDEIVDYFNRIADTEKFLSALAHIFADRGDAV